VITIYHPTAVACYNQCLRQIWSSDFTC